MIELRFHRGLYDGNAIDAALKVFAEHARFEQRVDDEHFVVAVSADDDEHVVARELANYALGLTIRSAKTGGVA